MTSTVTLAVMCLLVVVSRADSEASLVIGANRDERLDRPATAMTVLCASGPRILGGRDEEAGGTWLAVNEHGVVAGLTNRPSPDGRDPAKRSRGELPLALARHGDAGSAVDDFVTRFRPADYNPAWLLVGDRASLYALDMTGGDAPVVEALGPGVFILENNPLLPQSPKATHIRGLLGEPGAPGPDDLIEKVQAVLVDHSIPATVAPPATAPKDSNTPGRGRAPETLAACVHTDTYGTRSSTLVSVSAAAGVRPRVLVADGHPCSSPFLDVTNLFEA